MADCLVHVLLFFSRFFLLLPEIKCWQHAEASSIGVYFACEPFERKIMSDWLYFVCMRKIDFLEGMELKLLLFSLSVIPLSLCSFLPVRKHSWERGAHVPSRGAFCHRPTHTCGREIMFALLRVCVSSHIWIRLRVFLHLNVRVNVNASHCLSICLLLNADEFAQRCVFVCSGGKCGGFNNAAHCWLVRLYGAAFRLHTHLPVALLSGSYVCM